MSDENTANENQEDKTLDNSGENNNDSGVEKQPEPTPKEGEDKGSGEDKGGENGQPKEDQPPKPKSEDDSQLGTEDNGEEPPVAKRNTPKDFIIKRQLRKIEKLKGQDNEEEDNSEEEENDLLPEDDKAIRKVVSEALSPILEQTIQAEDDKEISQFVKDNPEFAPYATKAKRYISHPSRRNLPIETVFLEVVGRKKLMQMGAEKQRLAEEEARKGQGVGSTAARGGQGGSKPVWEMSDEEFQAEQERVRRGQ